MNKILITRPSKDGIITSKKLHKLGFQAIICPLIIVNRLNHKLESNYEPDLLIFSSKNSVRLFSKTGFENKVVFCVGDGTFQELCTKNYKNIFNVDGNAKKILGKFSEDYGKRNMKVLHPCGTNIKKEFKDFFSMQGSEYLQLPVYSLEKKNVNPDLFEDFFDNNGRTVLIFSQITAESFIESLYELNLNHICECIDIFAMSESISNYLQKYKFRNVITSNKPNEDNLLNTLKEKFK